MARKTATAPKLEVADEKAPQTRKTTLPPRPASPEMKVVQKKDKGGPQEDLRWAENALTRAIETYKTQSEHKANADLDFTPFWERLNDLEGIYNEKGFLKSKRDLVYDWAGFSADAKQVEEDILQAVLGFLQEKFNRMVWTADLTDQEAQELLDEADEKNNTKGKIWGWSNAVRKLRARGCTDPEDQPRGGRQSGGNRRGRG